MSCRDDGIRMGLTPEQRDAMEREMREMQEAEIARGEWDWFAPENAA